MPLRRFFSSFPLQRSASRNAALPRPATSRGRSTNPARRRAPPRASLVEPGARAEKLVLAGTVRSADCRPLANVRLDFWQADEKGDYDNAGFRYRGVVATDAQGRYRLETILPPPYMGRPRHIHVKLQRPGGRVLTTQLYFPGESRNQNPALVVKMEAGEGARRASYDFVL